MGRMDWQGTSLFPVAPLDICGIIVPPVYVVEKMPFNRACAAVLLAFDDLWVSLPALAVCFPKHRECWLLFQTRALSIYWHFSKVVEKR